MWSLKLPISTQGQKQHKRELLWFEFSADIPDPYAWRPRVQKVSPHHQGHRKHTFWCRRPRFSVRTCMTRRVLEKLLSRKFALTSQMRNSEPQTKSQLYVLHMSLSMLLRSDTKPRIMRLMPLSHSDFCVSSSSRVWEGMRQDLVRNSAGKTIH